MILTSMLYCIWCKGYLLYCSINLNMRFLICLFFIFLFSSSESFAFGKLGFGVRFSPNLSFVSFEGDELRVKINEDLYKSFANSILVNGEVFIEKKFPKVAFGFGMGYKKLSEQTETIILNEPTLEQTLSYVHDYGTIPMYMRLNLTKRIFIRTGVTSLVNLRNRLTSELTNTNDGSSSKVTSRDDIDYNMFNISGDLGVGYTLINSKIAIDIEPVFSKNLIGLLKGDVSVNTFQSSLGFSMTIRY